MKNERLQFLLMKEEITKIQKLYRNKYNKCYICFDNGNVKCWPYTCTHSLCISCFKKWCIKSSSCPTCRSTLGDKEIYKNMYQSINSSQYQQRSGELSIYADTNDSVPRGFRPDSPIYSPRSEDSVPRGFQPDSPIYSLGSQDNLDYDLLNAYT